MTASYLERLNPQQRRAVEHGGAALGEAGPLLIIAGAGSGKTNTLAHRVAHLIINGADPRRILLLTFSRRAAAEMGRRVEHITATLLRERAAAMTAAIVWSGTFHAVGARLLRDYAERIGLPRAFTIHDREDAADLLNLLRHDLGYARTARRFPTKGTCLAIYSRAVNAESPLDEVLAACFPWCADWEAELRALYAAYVQAKQDQHVLDYDDLLLYWAHMMAEPAIAADVSSRFDHVLVDEYQDTNRLQAAILLALKPNGAGLTVVGDDAQSIYSFRAATVRNILDFPGHFSPRAEVVTLERNYRSTQAILAAANGVIDLADERFTKNLWSDRVSAERPQLVSVADEAGQARYVVESILQNRECGIALKVASRAVSRLPSLRTARSGAHAPQYSVRQVRRPEIPRGRTHQGRAGVPALCRESARPGLGLSRHSAPARRRTGDRRPGARLRRRRPRWGGGRLCGRRFGGRRFGRLQAAGRSAGRLAGVRRNGAAHSRPRRRLARRDRAGLPLVPTAPRTHP